MEGFRRSGVGLAMAALCACGGDSTTGPPSGGGTTEQWVTVASGAWTGAPQTESYKCHGSMTTGDEYFTGFRLSSPSAVQEEIFVAVSSAPGTIGDFDCNAGSFGGDELVYAAEPGTTQLAFSGGKGVHIASGKYVLLEMHLVNNGSASVTDSTVVQGRSAKAADVTIPMDMTLTGTLNISIPADDAPHDFAGACTAAEDFHIAAALPMLRALGKHLTSSLTAVGDSVANIFQDASIDPQHLVYFTPSSDLLVTANTRLTTTCRYVNNTGVLVNFGESADSEWCFDAIYRYPPKPPTNNSPLECARGQGI